MPRVRMLRHPLVIDEAEQHLDAVRAAGCDHEAVILTDGVIVMTACMRCLAL